MYYHYFCITTASTVYEQPWLPFATQKKRTHEYQPDYTSPETERAGSPAASARQQPKYHKVTYVRVSPKRDGVLWLEDGSPMGIVSAGVFVSTRVTRLVCEEISTRNVCRCILHLHTQARVQTHIDTCAYKCISVIAGETWDRGMQCYMYAYICK